MFTNSLVNVALVLATQAALGVACSQGQPSIKDANTVTLNFFADSDALIETISIGVVGTCHTLDAGAATYNQAVGQNLFGRNLRIDTFTSSDCSGVFQSQVLTNAGLCYVSDIGDWHSVKVASA